MDKKEDDMQQEILVITKGGKELCALDLVEIFKISRQHASTQLSKMEHTLDCVEHVYRQKPQGSKMYLVKYYRYTVMKKRQI